jgi:MoaA/NifB/PqqE/SkfB family radical SAM enzyme
MNISVTRKLLNVFVVNVSRLLGLKRTFGHPFFMTVDPCTACNLQCPLCIQGSQKGEFDQRVFDFKLFEKVMKQYGPWLTHLGLYSWGEPFLNKRIYDMIALAKSYDIDVTISTNLNVGDPQKIVDSGLDSLACSLDGATQETYEKYRVGGNLKAALDRAREIVRLRNDSGGGTPALTWQYLLFEHNTHEVEAARAIADEIGFEHFCMLPGFVHIDHPVIKTIDGMLSTDAACAPQMSPPPGESEGDRHRRRLLNRKDQGCAWLYSSITLDPSGNVFPCCLLWHDSHSFASYNGATLAGLYNSENFRHYRGYFAARRRGRTPDLYENREREPHPCELCTHFVETSFSFETLKQYFSTRISLARPLRKLLKELMK